LLITADAGGSNGTRLRLWKWELQQLANRTGLTITTGHFPPGTSKWNTIEHRLFSYISRTWRGQPLATLAVIVNLIGATRTTTGLRVRCELDRGVYPKGHGRGAIVYKRSSDGGQTWSDRLPVPASWATSLEVPTIHRVVDANGKRRLIVWSGLHPARLAVSEDDGHNWSELRPVGEWGGIVACMQHNGNFQRGFILGYHDENFDFGLVSKKVATPGGTASGAVVPSVPVSQYMWFWRLPPFEDAKGRFLIGEFQDGQGRPYVMLVNKDLSRSFRFKVNLRKPYQKLTHISSYSGQEEPFGQEMDWIAPGAGHLFRLE
jgi:hypothetical protein